MGTSPRANKYEMILIVIVNIVLAVASNYWWETLQWVMFYLLNYTDTPIYLHCRLLEAFTTVNRKNRSI